ncbi:MAG: Spy/CpxP family protein refolding chaperone [Brachymonas sp.]|nr:Spy/CpxP family protein refolding chaperone [Brachymonas sp.]
MNPAFKLFSKPVAAIALLSALGAAPAAFAQQAATAPAAASNPIDMMKADLKITPAQEAVWQKYVAAYTTDFRPSQTPTPDQFNAMKTPERVAFLKKLHTEQNNFLFGRFDASVALYNALDANQKKTFDDMTAERAPQQQAPAAAPKGKARGKK